MVNAKPWTSMQQQLDLLKQRGMLVDNEPAALDYLARIGYYRLSGYWYPLRKIDQTASSRANRPIRSHDFAADSHFEQVVKLYVFDKKLRLMALDALERIEMAVRVDVAYLLGRKDPLAHENAACLHGNFTKKVYKKGPDAGKTAHQVWLKKYQSLLRRARREPFVEHHQRHYQGRLPIWVAIEVWDFGLLSRLFAGMQYVDKNQIAHKYDLPDGETLAKWLRSLNFIRNVSAHHSRLWNINVLETSPKPATWPAMENNKPFMYFSMMAHLLRVICPNSSWQQRLVELLEEFPFADTYGLSLADLGVCDNWSQWLVNAGKE